MLFSSQAINQLSAPACSKLLTKIDLATLGAKDRGREPTSTTETWLRLRTQQEWEAAITGGDIMEVVFLSNNTIYAVASCMTPLSTISHAVISIGCQ